MYYLDLKGIAQVDLLKDQLSNTVALLDHKVVLSKVEQDHTQGTLKQNNQTNKWRQDDISNAIKIDFPCNFQTHYIVAHTL